VIGLFDHLIGLREDRDRGFEPAMILPSINECPAQEHGHCEQREHEEQHEKQRGPQASSSSNPDRRDLWDLSASTSMSSLPE
jgi:hypothetical protein